MRPRGQILQKLKQVRFRHIKKELARLLKVAPSNCSHNRVLGPEDLGVCSLDCGVCDSQEDNRAPECEKFDPRYEKEALKESLSNFFDNRPVHEIAVRFPDVAALLWTLRDEGQVEVEPLTDQELLFLYDVPLWTDSAEELEALRDHLDLLTSRSKALEALATHLECDVDLKSIRDTLRERELNHKTRLENSEDALRAATIDRDTALQAIDRLEDELVQERSRKEVADLELPTVLKKPWWRFWS